MSGICGILYDDHTRAVPGDVLARMRQDSVVMAASKETRAPFLDAEVLNFSLTLPMNLKLTGRTGKWIEREVFGDVLPPAVLSRTKMGFPTPLKKWIAGPFHQRLSDTIKSRKAMDRRYFDETAIDSMLDQHRRGLRDWTDAFWLLHCFELWHQRFMDSP